MKLVEAVSIRLNNLLDKNNLTAYRVATDGGMPRATLSLILSCKNKSIKLDTIHQITATMGISLKEFFDDPIFNEVTD